MSWVDPVIVVVLIVAVAVQSKRGFLQSALDAVAGIVAVLGAKALGPRVPSVSPALGFAIVLVPCLAVLLLVSRFLYATTSFTVESWDPLLGACFGAVLGCTLGYALTTGLTLANNGERPESVKTSVLGEELATFRSYHKFANAIYGLSSRESEQERILEENEGVSHR